MRTYEFNDLEVAIDKALDTDDFNTISYAVIYDKHRDGFLFDVSFSEHLNYSVASSESRMLLIELHVLYELEQCASEECKEELEDLIYNDFERNYYYEVRYNNDDDDDKQL